MLPHNSVAFPPSTSAIKPHKGQRSKGLATAWGAFWFFSLERVTGNFFIFFFFFVFLEIFLKGSEYMWFLMDFSCQWEIKLFSLFYFNFNNFFFFFFKWEQIRTWYTEAKYLQNFSICKNEHHICIFLFFPIIWAEIFSPQSQYARWLSYLWIPWLL